MLSIWTSYYIDDLDSVRFTIFGCSASKH